MCGRRGHGRGRDPVANDIYGGDLVARPVVVLLFAAYTADLLLVSVSANLVGKHKERGLAIVACGQVTTMLLVATTFLQHGPIAVASAVLAGRAVGFTLMARLERRSLSQPQLTPDRFGSTGAEW